ncbi:MAG: AAA family ATPase [Planctomycetaceae bacterium]
MKSLFAKTYESPPGSDSERIVAPTEPATSGGLELESPPLRTDSAPVAWVDRRLTDLFERVNQLLGDAQAEEGVYRPKCPETIEEAGLAREEIEGLILKYLAARGVASGRQICNQVKLPYALVEPIVRDLKFDHLVSLSGTAEAGDFNYSITDTGRLRARAFSAECSYFGAAPVPLRDYLEAMAAQSIAKQTVNADELHDAFKDLIINKKMLDTLGPAINSGRGMFLFGEPGNGKTSIAERITRCFGSSIWIPRALGIEGEIIRVFDPGQHEELPVATNSKLFDLSGVDARWAHVVRPTIVVGGELTLDQLEVTQNPHTKVCEAPLQLKSNCGTFVIDDFGRQRCAVADLLNRWIVPLEKRYDFLNMPSGKKVQVPFDQLIIFSTNLEPRQLVDGAFTRRIPYKIQVIDPTEAEFHQIMQLVCPHFGFVYDRDAIEHLLAKHYRPTNRPLRSCQPRDLVLQVRNYCTYHRLPKRLTPEAFDFAVSNYFSVM